MVWCYRVGEILGKTLAEMRALPIAEVNGWIAYLLHKDKLKKEAGKKQRTKRR